MEYRYIYFHDWVKGLTMMKDLKINKTPIEDFLTKNILTSKRNVNDKNKENSKDKDNNFPHLPLQVHLMIKHKNMGKIDGHKWFFKGVWNMISPEFIQLIDWGSIPLQNSISHIIEYMNKNEHWGGAWGEIEWITSDEYGDFMGGSSNSKPWIKRQTNYMVILTQYIWILNSINLNLVYSEYKIAHYLDKAAESLFGFVSVLPGAFSTFRWEAVNGSPLDEFLKGSSNDIP